MTPGGQDAPEWVRDGVEPYTDSTRGYDRIVAACEDVGLVLVCYLIC